MARTKEFEQDGFKVRYASLNVVQIEHYIELKPAQTDLKHGQVTQWTLEVVCDSLNNASRATNGDCWTPERVVQEMDPEYINNLQAAILDFSNLKWKTPLGEIPASPAQKDEAKTTSA